MPNNPITVPLPADLPTNWVYGQTVGPNGTDVGLSEQHGYNYLMTQVNAAQTAAGDVGQAVEDLQPQTVYPYTHQKNGTVNALTGAEGAVYISRSMTAAYEYGETWTLNGTPVTVQYCDGSLVPPHQLITGDLLVGRVSGSVITLKLFDQKPKKIVVNIIPVIKGHYGGDQGITKSTADMLAGRLDPKWQYTWIKDTIESHRIVTAAEISRKNGGRKVDMTEIPDIE